MTTQFLEVGVASDAAAVMFVEPDDTHVTLPLFPVVFESPTVASAATELDHVAAFV